MRLTPLTLLSAVGCSAGSITSDGSVGGDAKVRLIAKVHNPRTNDPPAPDIGTTHLTLQYCQAANTITTVGGPFHLREPGSGLQHPRCHHEPAGEPDRLHL